MRREHLIENTMNHINPMRLTHDLFSLTIRPSETFIREFPYSDRVALVQDLTLYVIKKIQSHLIRKPTKNSTKHLLIDHFNVIESKTKYGSKDIQHQHGLWIVHKDISNKLDETLIHKIIRNCVFKFDNQTYSLEKAIHSILCVPISTQANLYTQWDDNLREWLGYIYKHSRDAKNNFYNEWQTFSVINNNNNIEIRNPNNRRDQRLFA